MDMAEDTLMLECRNCHMKFDSKEALHNHVTKFCQDSDYGNIDKLTQKFKEVNREKTKPDPFRTNLTMDEINKFLKGEQPGSREAQMGSLSLADLRHRVRDSEVEFEQAKKQYVAQREGQVLDELERFRREKQQLREKRNQEEAELLELIRDMEQKKERELQARVEKEQIAKAIRELEKTKLSTLEQEKRRELTKLANEREALRLKEEEILKEADVLRLNLEDQERAWKEERDEVMRRGQGSTIVKNPTSKIQMELARERGEKVAELKLKKQMMEQERLRIMEDLEKVKRGDLSRVRKNTSGLLVASSIARSPKLNVENMPEEAKRLHEQLLLDEERLEKLKKDHETMREQPLFPVEDAPKVSFPDEVDGLVKKAEADLPPRERARVLGHIKDNLEADRKTESPAISKPQATIEPPSYWSPDPPQFGNAPVPKAGRLMEELTNMRYAPTRVEPQTYQSYPVPQTQQPPPDNSEVKVLKKQIKQMQKKLENRDQDEFYQNMQGTLQALQMKMMGMEPQSQAQNPPMTLNEKDLMPEERALMNLNNQEAQDLRMLSTIPKDSDLYRAKMEHYKEITKQRAKMESMLSQLGMERMKRNFEREMELEERRLQSEKWVEEQRRALILAKMKDEEQTRQPQYISSGNFDPEAGFWLYWDFVTGVPTRFNQVQLVYGLFERGESRLPGRLVASVPLEPDTVSGTFTRGVFATQHDIKKVPPFPLINLIIEVQASAIPMDSDDRPKPVGIGWTVLNLFTGARRLQEGAWKIPVYRLPTDHAIELQNISSLLPMPNMYVYMRLAAVNSENDGLVNMPVAPNEYRNKYAVPSCHLRGDTTAALSPTQQIPRTQQSQQTRSNAGARQSILPTEPAGLQNPSSNLGIEVRIESLLNFISKATLQFVVSVQEGSKLASNDRGANCMWTSDPISGLRGDRLTETGGKMRVPGTNIRADPRQVTAHDDLDFSGGRQNPGSAINFIEIGQATSFYQNFYHLLEQNDWKDQIFVIIQIMEKVTQRITNLGSQDGRLRDVDSFVPIAWTIYQVSNPETRQLQFGSVDLILYKPPILVPIYDTDQLTQVEGTLKVTIVEPSAERYLKPASRRARSGMQDDQPPAGRREPFIENLNSQFDDGKLFDKGDGVDFYVDGARFLPDNTTCTKIVVKGFTSNLEKVGVPIGGLPELTSSVYSPVFGFRTEFRAQIFDPTSLIVIAIQTIDKHHGEVRVLGYSAINMFLHRTRKDQPVSANEQDYIINKGAFQLPIFCQEPYRKPPFALASFVKLERIPCATILVRIRSAAKSDDGLRTLGVKDALPSEWLMRGIVVPPPNYDDRIYNTAHCQPTTTERYVYQERVNRPDLSVRDATKLIQQQLGYQLDLNNEEMLDWIDQRLQVTPRTGLLDMKYFAQYSPKLGFKFTVDCVHNVPNSNANVALFCLNPPGALYQGTASQDVQFTTRIDWNSSVKTQAFKDGFQTYRNIMFDRNLHMIIDVRSVNFSRQTPEVQNVGWTLLQIFSDDGYIDSGVFQLPLFRGPVPVAIVKDLTTNKPWEYLISLVGKRGGPVLLEPTSVIVRLVDSQREGHFNTPMELQRMNYSYIPTNVMNKFSYNAAALAKSGQQKRLRTIIPNQGAEEPYQKKVNQGVANFLGLDHIVT